MDSLLGALTLGAGPTNGYRLVHDASRHQCLALTRLWLSDALPCNSESHIISIVLRNLARRTDLKFVVSYADPGAGHVGTIYQANSWLYTGLSKATPLYDLGDGVLHHSRSLGHSYGSRSVKHFESHGAPIRPVRQSPKHRYMYFLDPAWRTRLRVPVQPFPKLETSRGERRMKVCLIGKSAQSAKELRTETENQTAGYQKSYSLQLPRLRPALRA